MIIFNIWDIERLSILKRHFRDSLWSLACGVLQILKAQHFPLPASSSLFILTIQAPYSVFVHDPVL